MRVVIDGSERRVRVGAPVESLLSEEQRHAAAEGALLVVDAWGNRVGSKGALAEGGAYFTIAMGARPPSVNACLEAWESFDGAPPLPGEFVKLLVRRAITTLAKAGGAASAEGTAAFAAVTASREDGEAMWTYVAGEGRKAVVFAGGKGRVRDVLPGISAAAVATRDVLTFRSGATTFDYLDGLRTVEVGTTNRVKLVDYTRVFADADAVVMCRAGDFAIEGFVAAPEPGELAAAAAKAGVAFVNISADGALFDERGAPRPWAGDVVIRATPREVRSCDLVFVKDSLYGDAVGDAALAEEAAAALWRHLKKGE
jgi:hypothetical protein